MHRTSVALLPVLLVSLGLSCGGDLVGRLPCDAGVDAAGDAATDGSESDSSPDGDGPEPEERRGPVCVLLDDADGQRARAAGEDFFARAVTEVLRHAGIPFEELDRSTLTASAPTCAVLLLPYDADLDARERAAVDEGVQGGGTVVALSGTSGLEETLGVAPESTLDEGYVSLADDGGFLAAPPMPLHGFGITGAAVTTGSAIADLLDREGDPTGLVGISRRPVSSGEAWFFAADLSTTIVRIQQGWPIEGDGEPAPDGSAPVDDGILKTDDGIALDYVRDRGEVDGAPLFVEPIVDHWVDLLLRIVLRGCRRAGARLPALWYWPGELDAVGVLSHDTDGNDPLLARALLAELEAIGVESTWCFIQYPERYPAELFAEVVAAGFEVSLHYDARTPDNPATTWSEESFLAQLAWLESVAGAPVATNKNHYLRWEGWVDFYRWCESAGIEADQSRGPSKRGNVGFLYGTSHPHFPIDDLAHENRVIDVLAVDLLTQDLVHTCPYAVGPALVDRAVEHHGVAHFLFHPAHVERPGVAAAMGDIVTYGRALGMEWWTVRRLNDWERSRRRVTLEVVDDARFEAHASSPLADATFLIPLLSDETSVEVHVAGEPVPTTRFSLRGSPMARFTTDLPVGTSVVDVVGR